MQPGGNILNSLLDSFSHVCISGLSSMQTLATGTLGIMVAIDLFLSILLNLENNDHLQTLIKKILKYGMWSWFVTNWGTFVNLLIDSFTKAGTVASGGSDSIIKDPSSILNVGMNIASPLFSYCTSFDSVVGVTINFFNILFAGVSGIFIVLAFAVMAIQAFITYVEFYLMSTLTLIFIPFGTNKHTSFLAEKAFSSVVSFGVKFMVLTFILGIAKPLVESWTFPAFDRSAGPTWDQCMFVLVGCWILTFLCWQAPGLASGLMSGSPSLTGGSVAGAALATGSAVSGGASVAKAAGGALAGAAGSAARGAAGLAGAATGGAAGKSGLQAAAGALGGMASHVGGGIGSSIKDAFNGAAASASGGSGSSGGVNSSTSTGAGSSGGTSSSTSTRAGSGGGSTDSSSPASGGLASALASGASSPSGSSDGFSADAKTGLLLPSSVANSRNFKPVDNSTPPQSSSSSSSASSSAIGGAIGGASGVVASPKASDSNANASANQQGKPGVISSIAQLVNQGHSMIPPEASPSGGIHVPIKND